jgi:uncharacterized membrane protein
MPRVTVAGHPLHPQLVGFPIGLIPFSFAMDCMYAATGDKNYAKAAQYSLMGGAVGAVAAATAGVMDYLAIRNGTAEKKLATTHGLMNAAVLAIETVNLLRRRRGQPRSKALALAFGAISTVGLTVSQWYGGQLVYGHGVRVKGMQELETTRNIKPSWDDKIERSLHKISDKMPASGVQDKSA